MAHVSPELDPLAGRLRATFAALDGAGIPYVVLRGFDPIAELTTSADIDVYLPAAYLAQARPLLEAEGWFMRKAQTGRLPHLFFDSWDAPGGLVRSLDIVTQLCFGPDSRRLHNEQAVVVSRVQHHGVSVPSPWMTVFCFALHVLLDKGGLSAANAERALRMRERCHSQRCAQEELAENFGSAAADLARGFLDAATDDAPFPLEELRRQALDLGVLAPRPLLARWHGWRTRWRQLRRPVARIAIMGIDGSGKSTVVSTATQRGGAVRIHNGYLGNNHYRTAPARWLTDALHTRRMRGATSGLVFRVLANLESLWRPVELGVRMLIAEHRAEMVLYDRFPLGQDDGSPTTRWGRIMLAYTRMARRILPSPDLVVLLDGDDHTIWSRKREMPFELHVETQARYRALLPTLPWPSALVRSDRTIAETMESLRDAIAHCPTVQRKLYGS